MVGNSNRTNRYNIGHTESFKWFAWYPVRTNKGYRWLCFVEAKLTVVRSDFFLWKIFTFLGLDLGIGKDSWSYRK